MTPEELARIVRIETRVACIQEHLGLPTRMDRDDLAHIEAATEQPLTQRLARIETRIFKLMEAMSLNPRTGKKL